MVYLAILKGRYRSGNLRISFFFYFAVIFTVSVDSYRNNAAYTVVADFRYNKTHVLIIHMRRFFRILRNISQKVGNKTRYGIVFMIFRQRVAEQLQYVVRVGIAVNAVFVI